jgi:hypothetical protein
MMIFLHKLVFFVFFAIHAGGSALLASKPAEAEVGLRQALAAPSIVISAVEKNGYKSDVWQNKYNVPEFTFVRHDGDPNDLRGFYVYWGGDPNAAEGQWQTAFSYKPGVVTEGLYYLRVQPKGIDETLYDWQTLFVFKYDVTPPPTLSNIVEINGIQGNKCQKHVDEPAFTWKAGEDNLSGVDYYEYSFGFNRNVNRPMGRTSQPAYSPGKISYGMYYLSLKTVDKAGNHSNWAPYFYFTYDRCFSPGRKPLQYFLIAAIVLVIFIAILPAYINFRKPKKKPVK